MVERMKIWVATLGAVFLTTCLAAPTMGAGWFWDVGNGIGFAAFAGLLYLTITSRRPLEVRGHQLIGYAVLFLALAHVFWFLLGDGAASEFLKPGAPDYMWLGLVGLALLAVLMVVAVVPDRLHVHRDYASFRVWHRVLVILATGCITYHIVASEFYLNTWYQGLLFVLFATVVAFGQPYWGSSGRLRLVTVPGFLLASLLMAGTMAAVRNLGG